MKLQKYTLEIQIESKEGPHEFIPVLDEIAENIQGGYETMNTKRYSFKITPIWK